MTRSCPASPIAATPRRPAADVKAGRRPPAGLGLDTGENRRTLPGYGDAENTNTLTTITHIMPNSVRFELGPVATCERVLTGSPYVPLGRLVHGIVDVQHGDLRSAQLAWFRVRDDGPEGEVNRQPGFYRLLG